MKKGIIMEMDDSYLTLLTPEGEFLRTERNEQAYQLGDEIHFFPIKPKASKTIALKRFAKIKPLWLSSAAAVLILILGSLLPVYQDNKAYAYMSIDVNPSIELGVNKDMQVVELKGYNEDGKKIVSALRDWKRQEVSELTETIFTEMKKEGYLDYHHSVVISTVHSEIASKQAEEKLKQNINEIKQTASQQKLEVTVYSGTKDEMEKAHKMGMTTGQYQEHKQNSSLSKKANQNGKPQLENEDHKNKASQPKENHAPVTPPNQKEQKNGEKQKDSHIPPGQQKKQAENKPSENKPQSQPSQGKVGKDKKVPPGQQKKNDDEKKDKNENQVKNNGQAKKEVHSNGDSKGHSNGNKNGHQKEKNHK